MTGPGESHADTGCHDADVAGDGVDEAGGWPWRRWVLQRVAAGGQPAAGEEPLVETLVERGLLEHTDDDGRVELSELGRIVLDEET